MAFEKNSLSTLWKKMFGGPRFINIHGEPWDKQTKLRLQGIDATYAMATTAIMGLASLPSGTLSAVFTATAFGTGVALNILVDRMFEKRTPSYKEYVLPLEAVAIDTEGRAFPHPQTISLMRTARGGLNDSLLDSAIGASLVFGAPAIAGFGFPAYEEAMNIVKNISTANSISSDSARLLGFFSTTIMLPLARSTINSKLLARKYVFCAPPSAQSQTEDAGVLSGVSQHSYAPIPVPVRR